MNAAQRFTYGLNDEKFFLRTLLYFDIFNYPLTAEEIAKFSSTKIDLSYKETLENLVAAKVIFRFGDFYSIQNNTSLVERRINGNEMAKVKMNTARRYSRIIAAFPFVRAVMLSGSISKDFMDEKSDIDYFIITEVNRLWVVRTSLALFRRIFLFNSHKNFCTNYFIDTKNLNIPDRNIFTAIELFTLKSTFGESIIRSFREANQWSSSFLPQCNFEEKDTIEPVYFFKEIFERIFPEQLFNKLNDFLMKKTVAYWKRKYASSMSSYDFEIAFRSTIGVSKSHPQFYQKKALSLLDKKIRDFEIQHNINLSL